MEVIREIETSGDGNEEETEKPRLDHRKGSYKVASLEVLNHVTINATVETPRSTVRSAFNFARSELHYNKKELKDAQEKLKLAFIEFHEKLRFLKSYA